MTILDLTPYDFFPFSIILKILHGIIFSPPQETVNAFKGMLVSKKIWALSRFNEMA